MKVRSKLFRKVEDLGMQEIKQFSTSSLITRTTNDITQVEMLIAMGLQLLIKAPITTVWAVTKILNKSWQWSAITGVAVLILLSVIGVLFVIVMPRFKRVQKLIDRVNGVTRENLTGIRVVRAFNAEDYQENKFEDVNNKLTNQQLFNQKTFAVMQPVMYLIMYFLTLAIYFVRSIFNRWSNACRQTYIIWRYGCILFLCNAGNNVIFNACHDIYDVTSCRCFC